MILYDLEKIKQFANQLAEWDKHIVEITAIKDLEGKGEAEKLDLICNFDPEPQSDTTGFFWIANLLTRMEFEGLDVGSPFDLGFTINNQIFMPNGKIFKDKGGNIILWANHGE